MKQAGQLENLFIGIISILLILSLIIYYFQFKTGTIPIFKTKKTIEPAEKGVIPKGTFFKEQKLPYLFLKFTYAQNNKKDNKKYKPNKNLETYIISPKSFILLEDNKVDLIVNGQNKVNSLEKLYFQYKIYPLHKDWQNLYGKQKRILLPNGVNFYTIYVRAINKNLEVDPTPAISYFYTNISKFFKYLDIEVNYKKDKIIIRNKSKESINVNNWRIKSSKVNFYLSKAVKDVNPNLQTKLEEIILDPGERLIIFSSKESPLGFNFKINKCFPYLAELRQELKQLLKNFYFPCQKFNKGELFNLKNEYKLSNNCLNILEKISCSGPKFKDWEKIGFDSNCYRFFENNFTYYGCYQNKKNDQDFYLRDWLIFIPIYKNFTNDRYDEIKIYDQNNLLVNKKIIY